jgi:ADP-dependent phosphofructokinase/glucokinase
VILDCDQKTNSYEKLALLAKNNDIELAYSKPKFEAFLLAIFENYSHHQIKKIDELLNKEMQKEFNEFYKKGESKEICNYIEKFPSKLNNALKFCAT